MKLYHTETREDASAGVSGEKGPACNTYYPHKEDEINPSHYEFGDMEARHFLDKVFKYGEFEAWQAPYISNAIEYIVRAPRKNGLEDFKKAQRNLDILIEKLEAE